MHTAYDRETGLRGNNIRKGGQVFAESLQTNTVMLHMPFFGNTFDEEIRKRIFALLERNNEAVAAQLMESNNEAVAAQLNAINEVGVIRCTLLHGICLIHHILGALYRQTMLRATTSSDRENSMTILFALGYVELWKCIISTDPCL